MAAERRERAAFDHAAGERKSLVILGAGRLGRMIRKGLHGTDLAPVAFADNNPALWNQTLDGLPVLSPEAAATRHATAVFVIAVWHPSNQPLLAQLLAQLRQLNCRAVPFAVLFWRFPERFLSYFFWDLPSRLLRQRHDIAAAFRLLGDEPSRQAFVEQIRLRLHADVESLCAPEPAQYFPGLFSLSADECFVDCGAYTGDTIRAFTSHTGGLFRRLIAFEADSAVLHDLEQTLSETGSHASLHRAAVGSQNGVIQFAGDGMGSGKVATAGGTPVPCVRLDDALARERVTFIKMDIEGAELQALEGAHRTIWRDRPVLAVCGYHTPDHLWRVGVALKTLAPDSLLFLRSHCADGLDTVWYAVPPERRAQALTVMPIKLSLPVRPRTQGSPA